MPYTKPTVDDFTTRFPIFADYDEDQIQRCLDEAFNMIDATWREVDFQPGVLYLAAHLLATDNAGEGEEVAYGNAGSGAIASESFGGMSISYANGSSNAGSLSASEAYGSTVYGRRFLQLLRYNRGGPVVA